MNRLLMVLMAICITLNAQGCRSCRDDYKGFLKQVNVSLKEIQKRYDMHLKARVKAGYDKEVADSDSKSLDNVIFSIDRVANGGDPKAQGKKVPEKEGGGD